MTKRVAPFEKLQDAVSPAAFHNSAQRFDPPKCHPNTRVAVLERIMEWILGNEHKDALVMWLFGPAGAGKSAIAQSIAELCATRCLLLASFFFSRMDSTRNHGNSLFPTLAYQIASIVPETRVPIEAVIEQDPLVFNRSLEAQIEALVLGPLRRLFDNSVLSEEPVCPALIIIDGLDECVDSAVQCSILDVISRSKKQHELPLKFLISSRPEQDLTIAFNYGHLNSDLIRLALDDSYFPNDDIERLLRDQFQHLKQTHLLRTHIPSSWPSDETIKHLVKKSSGQFIYASTVLNYVKSIRHRPTDRLEIVLGTRPSPPCRDMPFAELDALYSHILSGVNDIESIYDVLGLLITPEQSIRLNISNIESFLFLRNGEIPLLFGDLGSIISCESNSLKILHASLPDFLLDPARSREFYINPGLRNARLLNYCMRQIYNERFTPFKWAALQIDYLFSNADPTADLHRKILDFSVLNYNIYRASCDVPCSVLFTNNILCGIKKSKFDDADRLYRHLLKEVDRFWIDFINRQLNKKFIFLTLFAGFGIDWGVRFILAGNGPEDVLLHIYTESAIPDYTRFFIDTEFCKFLEDPTRSGDYAVDGRKYAMVALLCFKCLCNDQLINSTKFSPALSHLPFLLKRSAKSDQLVNFVLNHTLPQKASEYPQARQLAEEAIADYLCMSLLPVPKASQ